MLCISKFDENYFVSLKVVTIKQFMPVRVVFSKVLLELL